MTDGLRALMRAAQSRPLDFPISMYVGSVTLTGRVAPAEMWSEITRRSVESEAEQVTGGRGFGAMRRREHVQKVLAGFRSDLDRIGDMAEANDEITLIDARAFPAVGAAGAKSDGRALPVVRVPLVAVDMWWIAEGGDIEGSGGAGGVGFSAGVTVPIE